MKYLYLDGSCGISGDMTVAALLDLGASRERLESAIHAMHLEGMHCHIERGNSYSIAGMNFDVHVHTHHGEESADHIDAHEEGYVEYHHEHNHEHHHDHCEGYHHEHGHHHEHRHLAEVYHILEHAAGHCAEHNPAAPAFSSNALDISKKIFRIIAEAEAKAHGVAVEDVHFHEVGAIDSIVDIMAVAVLVDDLRENFGIEKCVVTGLNEGFGFVQTQHGMLPIPVPAVASIAEAAGIALHVTDTKGEMVTPTGIGVVAALRTSEKLPEQYKILKTGIGLGKRDFGRANFLRAQIIEDVEVRDADGENIFMIECNIDDQSPEELGLAMEKIFEAGARDVHYVPCYMKKNRPAVILRVLTDSEKMPQVETAIFRHTTTVGLRRYPVSRTCMNRSFADIATPYGTVTVKKCELGDIVKYKPEFDSVKKVADQAGVTYREVSDAAKANAKF
ncbi:nickel pincer cofactor biosynthesis protein LarC [Fibrobacter sp. UWH1]|uniref:nickel pincer cofactor biosynthesis protein LarC n=1 Tax=Fibrobacter sp. UWH1 TaxID=1964354 RepID=UPI000B520D38|nr:nickel pincer cofactor biosynthesis protein LarC [Fibrobacter sp. UWH1]OWV07912.1 TIGR00299 family protein [Fibrobacter sp. UWH1]